VLLAQYRRIPWQLFDGGGGIVRAVLRFAPRLDPRLVAAAERLDARNTPIAETNRRVGAIAEELGLARPSYQTIRVVINRARERGRRPTSADVLLDIAFRVRPPEALLQHLTGTLPRVK
jgi:hypothetical protein